MKVMKHSPQLAHLDDRRGDYVSVVIILHRAEALLDVIARSAESQQLWADERPSTDSISQFAAAAAGRLVYTQIEDVYAKGLNDGHDELAATLELIKALAELPEEAMSLTVGNQAVKEATGRLIRELAEISLHLHLASIKELS